MTGVCQVVLYKIDQRVFFLDPEAVFCISPRAENSGEGYWWWRITPRCLWALGSALVLPTSPFPPLSVRTQSRHSQSPNCVLGENTRIPVRRQAVQPNSKALPTRALPWAGCPLEGCSSHIVQIHFPWSKHSLLTLTEARRWGLVLFFSVSVCGEMKGRIKWIQMLQ